MKNPILIWLQKACATLLFIGYFPWMPGTIGSAITVGALWWFFGRTHVPVQPLALWLLALGVTAFSTIVSSRPREVFGEDDPGKVIIDECAGQIVSFLFIPLNIKTLVLGLVLFRFFDIVKPFPVHRMETLEGGLGITMDDVMAGILTNVCMLAIIYSYHFIHGLL
ncbi:MAG TPA: phosphatidylglycerophosphatase A [Chitinivibrionales bacterium]|nr:phosphatidylglycerophosphatase A [Chitinivibrionales bacterium]